MYKNNISFFEKLIAAASYITFGTVGFIWLLLTFLTKADLKPFLRYHAFQSIFISILYFIVSSILGLIMQILSIIPFINKIAGEIYFGLNMPFVMGISIINLIIYMIIFYLALSSLLGRFSYLPWVSEIIKENIKKN